MGLFSIKNFFSAITTHCRCSRFFQRFGRHCRDSQQQPRSIFKLLHILRTYLHFFNLSISPMCASLSISLLQEVANLYSSKIQTIDVSSPRRCPVIVDAQSYTMQQIYTSQVLRQLTLPNDTHLQSL